MNIRPIAWAYLVLVGLWVPWACLGVLSRVCETSVAPTRRQHFLSVCVTQGAMLAFALWVARIDWIVLFPWVEPRLEDLGLALAFLVPALGTLPLRWSWKSESSKRRAMWVYPHRMRDLGWWSAVSLLAGIGEEIVYRGVLFTLCLRLLGSWWAAALACATSFALAHVIQGWRSVALIAAMSLAMHGLVLRAGNLYTAMVIHFTYDMLAGVLLIALIRRDGLLEPPVASDSSSAVG